MSCPYPIDYTAQNWGKPNWSSVIGIEIEKYTNINSQRKLVIKDKLYRKMISTTKIYERISSDRDMETNRRIEITRSKQEIERRRRRRRWWKLTENVFFDLCARRSLWWWFNFLFSLSLRGSGGQIEGKWASFLDTFLSGFLLYMYVAFTNASCQLKFEMAYPSLYWPFSFQEPSQLLLTYVSFNNQIKMFFFCRQ